MNARKVDTVTEDVVACLVSPSLRSDLTERERRALEFLDLLATDHHRIDDEVYRGLAEVFTTAEIIELGQTCGHMIGTHRFIHTLDPYGDAPPVIRYDPTQVGVSWVELHGDQPATQSP
jgi:alkylhydroperoxidase family enzyme